MTSILANLCFPCNLPDKNKCKEAYNREGISNENAEKAVEAFREGKVEEFLELTRLHYQMYIDNTDFFDEYPCIKFPRFYNIFYMFEDKKLISEVYITQTLKLLDPVDIDLKFLLSLTFLSLEVDFRYEEFLKEIADVLREKGFVSTLVTSKELTNETVCTFITEYVMSSIINDLKEEIVELQLRPPECIQTENDFYDQSQSLSDE